LEVQSLGCIPAAVKKSTILPGFPAGTELRQHAVQRILTVGHLSSTLLRACMLFRPMRHRSEPGNLHAVVESGEGEHVLAEAQAQLPKSKRPLGGTK